MEKRQYDRYEDYSQDSLRYTSMEETNNEVLIITIDIGDGRKDELLVREDDDPRMLAEQFCKKHRLGPEVRQALVEQIEQNLDYKAEDDMSTLLSVNKSYESHNKRNQGGSVKSSLANETAPIVSKPAPSHFKEKISRIEEMPAQKPEIPANKSFSINNYGEKLYLKGIKFIENVNRKKMQIQQQNKEKEMEDTTFRPKINSQSSDRKHVQDLLLRKGKEKQEHIEKKRGEKLAEELSACTFSPLICKKSEKIVKSADQVSSNRFMRLYDNAMVSQLKIKQINDRFTRQQCPFVPETNKRPKFSQANEKRDKISQSRKAIEEYLSSKNATKDPKTGQDFFKPVVGRPPKGVFFKQRAVSSKNIGEYLYSKRSKSQDSKRPSTQMSKLSSQQSDKILSRIKELRYKQIFEDLHPNEYERITPEGISRSALSPRTFKILSPLLKEMQDLNEKLNFVEFQESMEILMKVLRPDERSIVLKTCKSKSPVQEADFRPKINQSSIFRPKSVENLYERNLKHQRWVKERTEQERKMKELSEMNECTFKPKILKYSVDQSNSLDTSGFEPFLPLSGSYYY